ncbi:hypothetical protein DFH27DRAFT_245818 [Peziza echinospora]|nr:hypothetical protein DFH27DRAFT_245818 [Peziza echinospora]
MSKFNYFHIAFTLTRDHLSKSALIDAYFRRCLELNVSSISQQSELAFGIIDRNPKELANKIYKDPASDLHLAALRHYWKGIYKNEEKLQAEGAILAHSDTGLDGHFGVSAGRVTGVKINREMIEKEEFARTMLRSFSQGGMIISPEWMARLEKAEDRHEFLMQNYEKIDTDSKVYFEKGGKLADCGALLGYRCLVKIRKVVTLEESGRVVQSMVVATTDIHNLDGVNEWMFSWDPAKATEVIFSNALMGRSPVSSVIDFLNNELGRGLMQNMWETVPEMQKAEEAGVNIDDWLAKHKPKLMRARRFFQCLDWFSKPAIALRAKIGGNMVAPEVVKEFTDDFENPEDKFKKLLLDQGGFVDSLPNSTRQPGVTINGEPILASTLLFPTDAVLGFSDSLDRLSPAELGKLEQKIKENCNIELTQEGLNDFRKTLDHLYDAQVDPKQVASYETKFAEIVDTTNFNSTAKEGFKEKFVNDAVDSVTDDLAKDLTRYSSDDLRDIAVGIAMRTVLYPFLRPQGLFAKWGYERIRALSHISYSAMFTAYSLKAELDKLTKEGKVYADKRKELEMQQGHLEKSDAKYMELEEKKKEAEEALKKTQETQDGLDIIDRELNTPDSVVDGQRDATKKAFEEARKPLIK